MPWKCESILPPAREVGCEIVHLHLKQQAHLPDAQNRPAETGGENEARRYILGAVDQNCARDCVKGPKMDTNNTFSLAVFILTSTSERVAAIPRYRSIFLSSHPQSPVASLFLSRAPRGIFMEFIPWVNYSCASNVLGLCASVRREEMN